MDLSQLKDKDFKIFVDTSALLNSNFLNYLRSITNNLLEKKTGLIVIQDVIIELKAHEEKRPDLEEEVAAAKNFIEWAFKMNIVKSFSLKNYADNSFLGLFTYYRTQYNLSLITADNTLSEEILNLNQSKAVAYLKEIRVYNLDKKGIPYQRPISHHSFDKILPNQVIPFKNSRTVVNQSEFNPKTISYIPETGNSVIADNGNHYLLKRKIAEGGEGSIYEFSQIKDQYKKSAYDPKKCLIKIYHKNIINKARIEKLKLMINNKSLEIEGVCFPLSIIYNDINEVVGFVMQKAGQGQKVYDLQRSIMIRPVLENLFPGWKKNNLVAVCLNIVNTINAIHKYNIILGDINEQNILVDSNSRVYFIDTDSYQIENYPCPVGSATFTHPDILRKNYKTFLRSIEHERFAVATLLFKILLPGLSPYTYQGGSNPAANVKARKFVFPYADNSRKIYHQSNQLAKNSIWSLIWDNLPHNMREAFYFTFAKGEIREINDPLEQISNVEDVEINAAFYMSKKKLGWINLLFLYKNELENGYHINDLFPSSRKVKKSINVDKATAGFLIFNQNTKLLSIRKKTNVFIRVFNNYDNGDIRPEPLISLIGLDEDSVNQAIDLIQGIKSFTKILTLRDIFEFSSLQENFHRNILKILRNEKESFRDLVIVNKNLFDFNIHYNPYKKLENNRSYFSNDEIIFLEENKDSKEQIYFLLVVSSDSKDNLKNSEKIVKSHLRSLMQLLPLSDSINFQSLFSVGGSLFKKACKNVGIDPTDVIIDTENRYLLIRASGHKEVSSSLIDFLETSNFCEKSYKFFDGDSMQKNHIISHSFSDEIDSRYHIERGKDYFLKFHFDEEKSDLDFYYFNNSIDYITIAYDDENILENILKEYNNCISWSYSGCIPFPKSITKYLIGAKGSTLKKILKKCSIVSPFDGFASISNNSDSSKIYFYTRRKKDFNNLSKLLKKCIDVLLSSDEKIKNLKKLLK